MRIHRAPALGHTGQIRLDPKLAQGPLFEIDLLAIVTELLA
jgi:hypothetical protein